MITQAQFESLLDRLRRVHLSADPSSDREVINHLLRINPDEADPTMDRFTDRQFEAFARPVVWLFEREQTYADKLKAM